MQFKFTIRTTMDATPGKVYNAWLNSKSHSAMTETDISDISKKKDAKYMVCDGYIFGKNVVLIPFSKIIQTWRTTEFKKKDPDSLLEISLEEKNDKTLLTLTHSNVPEIKYRQGWKDYYFAPMKTYFKNLNSHNANSKRN